MIRINGTEVVLQPLGMPRDVSAAAPERVRGLDFSGWIRADEIEVRWLAPFISRGPAIAGYRVDVSSDGGASWRVLAPLVAGTSHVHRGLRARSTRHYRVRAVAADGTEGPAAGVVQATTGHGVLDLEVTSRPAVGDTYRAGESIVVAVTMSTAMTYREPRLPLRVGGREREASCRVGAGSDGVVACPGAAATRLSLSYVVVAQDRDEDGIAVEADVLTGREFSREGGIVADLGGVGALPHPGVGPLSGHEVDGRPLRVSVAGAPVVEEGEAAAFTVMLSEPAREPVTVVWSTVVDLSAHDSGSAAPGTELRAAFGEEAPTYVDYEPVAAAMLTFAPGETQRTVSVPTLADGRDEYEETFLVRLDSVQGGGAEVDASAAQARARIVDTDPAPAIEVVPALRRGGRGAGVRGGSRVREALRPASDAGLVDGGRDGSGGVGLHRGGGADADPRTGTDAGDAGGADPRRRGARGGGDVPGAGAVRVAVGAGIGGGGGRGRGDDRGRRRAGEAGLAPGGGRGGAVRL